MGDQLEKVNLEEINLGAFLFMVGGSKLVRSSTNNQGYMW